MKKFDDLFQEAKEIQDRRLKAFNQLTKKFWEEILPKFAETISMCGYTSSMFRADNKIFKEDMFVFENYEYTGCDREEFCFLINSSGEIFTTDVECTGYSFEYQENNKEEDRLLNLKRTGILELVRLVNERLEKYTEKLFKDAVKAEAFLEK